MMSACGGKKAVEPSSVEKEETEKATREETEKETEEETEKEEAFNESEFTVPGYALGEIPVIPACFSMWISMISVQMRRRF